jgi:hypothetical protein
MADATTDRYLYPPNWDGFYPTNGKGHKKYVLNITSISDGGGETDVHKVILADHLTTDGVVPTKISIIRIDWEAIGYTRVVLEFDRDPDAMIAVLSGNNTGNLNYKPVGGLLDNGIGGTGDIKLSTVGHDSGDVYNITITYKVKP